MMKAAHSLLLMRPVRASRCSIPLIVAAMFFVPVLYRHYQPSLPSSPVGVPEHSSSANGGQVEQHHQQLRLELSSTPRRMGNSTAQGLLGEDSKNSSTQSGAKAKPIEDNPRQFPQFDSITRANSDTLPQESYFAKQKKNGIGSAAAAANSDALCEKADAVNCIRKFQEGLPYGYRVLQNYKLVGCLIRKNMSAMMRAIFCYLSDEEKFQASGTTLSSIIREWHRKDADEESRNRLCKIPRSKRFPPVSLPQRSYSPSKTEPPRQSILTKRQKVEEEKEEKEEEEEDREGGWNLMAIVREPVDRFLSGFIFLCILQEKASDPERCNGCGYNLTCFIITEYQRMKSFEGSNSTAHLKEDEGKLGGVEDTGEDRHITPQNWRCDFKNLLSRYTLVHYSAPEWRLGGGKKEILAPSAFPARLAAYLGEKLGVGAKSLRYIREQLSTSTIHVTHDTKARRFLEQRLRGSPFLMEFLVRMFYWDFRLLGFPLPTLNWGEKRSG